MTSDLEDGF